MRYLFLLLLFFVLRQGVAQQLPYWSQFRHFNYVYNPAYFEHFEVEGDGNTLDIDLAYRMSWTSIEGSPRTGLFGAHYTNGDANMSLGGFVTHDQFGPTAYTRLQGFYNYRLRFSSRRDHGLAIGVAASAAQLRVNGSEIKVENPDDNLIGETMQTGITPDISAGLYYYLETSGFRSAPKYLIIGLAADQGLNGDVLIEGKGAQANLKRKLHFNAMVAGRLYYGPGADFFEPLVIGRMAQNAPIHLLAGGRVTFAEQFFRLGAMVSSAWEAHLQFGLMVLPDLYFGYAGAFYLSGALGSTPGMSHELSFKYQVRL